MPSLSSIILLTGIISSVLVEGNNRIGYSGTLSSLSGGLQGTVTVINSTALTVSNYELQDSSAPALYWWGTNDGVLKDGFRISNHHITTATKQSTDITIELDAGKTTADFSTVGLWCENFHVDFGQATLMDNGGGNSTTAVTTTASTPSQTSGSASVSTGGAVGMVAPASYGVLAGVLASGLFF